MLAASLLINLVLGVEDAVLIVHHARHRIDFSGSSYLLTNFLAVEAAVALFTVTTSAASAWRNDRMAAPPASPGEPRRRALMRWLPCSRWRSSPW